MIQRNFLFPVHCSRRPKKPLPRKTYPIVRREIFAGLVMVCIGSFVPQSRGDDPAANVPEKVALTTAFLARPVGRAHQITIRGQLGGKGEVTLDGNTCSVNQFGDSEICTEIFFAPIEVDFVQLRLADPSGQGRRIYRLDGKLAPENYHYFLVVPHEGRGEHRLVINAGDDNRRVITLVVERPSGQEPQPDPHEKSDLCKNAQYRAEQISGKVIIYATGENPTAAYKVFFEQLPIRIYPPQFRLLCIKPDGPAAQVITPFKVMTSFQAQEPVSAVVVHDASGQHRIPVEQVSDRK